MFSLDLSDRVHVADISDQNPTPLTNIGCKFMS